MFFTTAIIASFMPLLALGAPSPAAAASEEMHILPDLGSGVFLATLDPTGSVNVTKISDVDLSRRSVGPAPAHGLNKRIPISNWGCGATMPAGDFDAAKSEFNHWCDQGSQIPPNGVLYSRRGLAIAYGCSWGGWNPCSSQEYNEFIHHAAANCGYYRSGWADMNDWKKQYGIHHQGEEFCGHWRAAA
jgi:hypothetical protein